MTRTAPPEVTDPSGSVRRRAVVAATIGNFIEWYDFVIYGYFAAQIAHAFFPSTDPVVGLLTTFATFGVALLVRPLGALFFGSLGDRIGRRSILSLVLLLASAATFLLGIIPEYAQIGVLAPILVVVARLVQGFSAGGEYGGATAFMVEYAPASKRAFYGSFQAATQGLAMFAGSLLGAALSTWMPADDLATWGWRIPFLIALPLGAVGLYLRFRLEETPAFAAVKAEGKESTPLRRTVSDHWRTIVQAMGIVTGWTTTTYMLIYLPSYIPLAFSYEPAEGLLGVAVGLAFYIVGTPLVALWADRIGRKPILMVAAIGSATFAIPAFLLLSLGGIVPLLAANIGIGIILAFYGAAGSTALSEMFPTKVRYTALSLGYSVAVSLFGGFSPLIATALLALTGVTFAPGIYIAIAGVVAIIAVSTYRETAWKKLA